MTIFGIAFRKFKRIMIDYISGKLAELTPTSAVVDNGGIGYAMEISLQTYDVLDGKTEATLYIQRQVNQRDGQEVDYGFATKEERNLFRNITGVSGMGAASARMILSSLSPAELNEAILSEDINRLKSVKGIGLKSAQRLVLELKDKIVKGENASFETLIKAESNKNADEAASALLNLGFAKPNISKAIQAILKNNPGASLEEIIKAALKML
jgi:holliday junction DNA helicase RuvA